LKGGGKMKLYYHKTSGGAEYLMDTFIKWEYKGKKGKEGTINDKTKRMVKERIIPKYMIKEYNNK